MSNIVEMRNACSFCNVLETLAIETTKKCEFFGLGRLEILSCQSSEYIELI